MLSKLHTLYHSGRLDINDLACQDQQFGIQSDFSMGSLTIQNIPEYKKEQFDNIKLSLFGSQRQHLQCMI